MNIATRFMSLRTRLGRRRLTRSPRAAKTRLVAELLETRNLLTTVFTSEHIHFELNFADGAWGNFQVNDTTHGVFYDPSDVLLYVDPAATQQIQPPGWNFIGAGDGNPYYKMDSSESSGFTSLAISAEMIPTGTFYQYRPNDPRITRVGEWIKFNMISVTDQNGNPAPGYVSSWQNSQPLPDQWWMSSFDGGRTLDSLEYIESGGHTHYNWGFTDIGIYEVTFQASAFVGSQGLPILSDYVTLTFGVGTTGDTGTPHGISGTAALATAVHGGTLNSPLGTGLGMSTEISPATPPPIGPAPTSRLDASASDGFFASTPTFEPGPALVRASTLQAPLPMDNALADLLMS
jgi:surface-anchored protein